MGAECNSGYMGGRGQAGGSQGVQLLAVGTRRQGVQYMHMGQGCSYILWVGGLGVQLTVGT